LLIDEQQGRIIAQRMGLNVTGIIGVLINAKSQGLIDSVQPYLDQLRSEANFYISEKVYQQALLLSGESA